MDVQRKEEILEQALELAFNLKDKGMKVQALTVIILHLDESKQNEIIDKAVYFKHEVQSKCLRREATALLRRAETLLSLAPHFEVSSTIS
jgi:hypothetical protein